MDTFSFENPQVFHLAEITAFLVILSDAVSCPFFSSTMSIEMVDSSAKPESGGASEK